tara:strand:+ start:48680 stop:48931 length:252 start_codon:yes stop_codon:yes gene_type:complete
MFTNSKKRRKRVTIYLYDDEINSFEIVSSILSRHLPSCNPIRAEQLALIAHNTGKVELCSGFSPEIYAIYAHLIKSGLLVETN